MILLVLRWSPDEEGKVEGWQFHVAPPGKSQIPYQPAKKRRLMGIRDPPGFCLPAYLCIWQKGSLYEEDLHDLVLDYEKGVEPSPG